MKKTVIAFLLTFLYINSFAQKFEYVNENLSVTFTDFKSIGEQLHCKFMVKAISKDDVFETLVSKIKIFDMEGNVYYPYQAKLGSSVVGKNQFLRSDLIADIPLKGEIIFAGAVSTRSEIAMLEMPSKLKNQKLDFNIRIKAISIPYGKTATNKELKNNKFYREIDDNIFIELKTQKKDEQNLIFNFLITNFSYDKDQALFPGKCKCIDDAGNEYLVNVANFGSESGGAYKILRKKCTKDTPLKMDIQFKDSKILGIKEIKLLEININNNIFQFKNIKLQ